MRIRTITEVDTRRIMCRVIWCWIFLVSWADLAMASTEQTLIQRMRALWPDVKAGVSHETAGMVLDQQFSPIPGAAVFAWQDGERVRIETDKKGHFRIANAPRRGGFLCVEADGFRDGGGYVRPGATKTRIILTRTSEAPVRLMRTPPDLVSTGKTRAQVRKLFVPFVDQCIVSGDESDKTQALKLLARVEPARALQYVQDIGFEEPGLNDYVRWVVSKMLLPQSMNDALAVIHSFELPMMRSMGLKDAANALPNTQRIGKLELLAEALLHARSVEAPDKRLVNLGMIAEQYLDCGETEQATRILREGQKIAQTLPTHEWPGYARGVFAEGLAQIDLDAALALTCDFSDASDHDRPHGNIAHALAGKEPANAQRVLGMMRQQSNRDNWSSRVCYHMASVDSGRARQIADAISDPCRRAYALGMMAQALAGSDKTGAGRLVQEAFVVLTECVSNPQQRPRTLPPTPQDVGLSLLPVVESIDAGLVQEYFWRTASLCKYRRYVTVACLGRYDPSLASQWLTHSGSRASGSRVQDYPSFYFAAVTQLDPEATVGLVAGLPEDSEEQRKGKLQAWTQVIEMITRNSRERWEWILDKEMHLWHVGKKDI